MSTNEFEIIEGTNNIMLIAPHGYMKPGFNNDEHTAELARLVADKLQCHAVINSVYRRPKKKKGEKADIPNRIVNLNDLREYKNSPLYDMFVSPIINTAKRYLEKEEPLYIFHIHGIDDDNIPKGLAIWLGVGLGETVEDTSLSAPQGYIDTVIKELNAAGLPTETTRHADYAARADHNLNQLFKKHLKLNGVPSVQLEIKKEYREPDQLAYTADKLIAAIIEITHLKETLPDIVEDRVDDILVEKAEAELTDIFSKHYKNALLEAGQYIINAFYGGDIKRAQEKRPVKELSYNTLKGRLTKGSPGTPGKSWLYNAVNLVVQEHHFSELNHTAPAKFQALGKLSNSHKLLLTSVPDIEQRVDLGVEAAENNIPSRKLAQLIQAGKKKRNPTLLKYVAKPDVLFAPDNTVLYSVEALKDLKPNQIKKVKDSIIEETERLEQYIKQYRSLSQKLNDL
jgi:hypothetical protein